MDKSRCHPSTDSVLIGDTVFFLLARSAQEISYHFTGHPCNARRCFLSHGCVALLSKPGEVSGLAISQCMRDRGAQVRIASQSPVRFQFNAPGLVYRSVLTLTRLQGMQAEGSPAAGFFLLLVRAKNTLVLRTALGETSLAHRPARFSIRGIQRATPRFVIQAHPTSHRPSETVFPLLNRRVTQRRQGKSARTV